MEKTYCYQDFFESHPPSGPLAPKVPHSPEAW